MKWLTGQEVCTAAAAGDDEALACTYKHWDQFVRATAKETQSTEVDISWKWCALCRRSAVIGPGCGKNPDCGACPLFAMQGRKSCNAPDSLWQIARSRFDEWQVSYETMQPQAQQRKAYARWQAAAAAMRDAIGLLQTPNHIVERTQK